MKSMKKSKMLLLCAVTALSALDADAQSYWRNTNPDPFGIHIGYLSKQWETDFGDHKYKENLWGEEDRRLHGLQIGLSWTPISQYGLGLYTGLFTELCFSSGESMGYDNFSEGSLYVPAHIAVNLPMGRESALMVHGGVGFNYAFAGEFFDDDYWYDDYGDRHYYEGERLHYGRDGWPRRFNTSLELGATLRIDRFVLNANYSWGMTDHRLYTDMPHHATHQNKISITAGWAFGGDW